MDSSDNEILDIVDEEDRVLGQISRRDAHSQNVLHRSVHIIVLDKDNKIFVQERSRSKDSYPGFFEVSLSGHVLQGESYMQAASRELREELGVDVQKSIVRDSFSRSFLQPVRMFNFHLQTPQENELVTVFLIKNFEGTITVNRQEVFAGKFLSLPEFMQDFASKKEKYTPGSIKAWDTYKVNFMK